MRQDPWINGRRPGSFLLGQVNAVRTRLSRTSASTEPLHSLRFEEGYSIVAATRSAQLPQVSLPVQSTNIVRRLDHPNACVGKHPEVADSRPSRHPRGQWDNNNRRNGHNNYIDSTEIFLYSLAYCTQSCTPCAVVHCRPSLCTVHTSAHHQHTWCCCPPAALFSFNMFFIIKKSSI